MTSQHRIISPFYLIIAIPAFFFLLSSFSKSPSDTPSLSKAPAYAIAIHGGAGTIRRENMSAEKEAAYRKMLTKVLKHGEKLLKKGKSSLDVVESCIRLMEDSPLFNAGRGAVFTNEGKNEHDASIMNGADLDAGAVAGTTTLRHPISAARAVMEKSVHVMLSGPGAETFARDQGLETVDPSWFRVDRRVKQLERAKEKEMNKEGHRPQRNDGLGLLDEYNDYKFGTVGVAVLDQNGNLAAGTSTGGMTNKRWGRIGDSPVIGAGTYADNATCAVSCTGHGEFFIRYAVAHDISALMAYKGMSLQAAMDEVIQKKLVKAGGSGGVIGVDAQGNIGMSFNSKGMYRGSLKAGGQAKVAIFGDE